MAKLKYDRVINISLTDKNVATIPKDEVWKVSIGPGYGGSRANLYGGGTISKWIQGPRGCLYPVSPSNTSKSKRLHGGDSSWLRNLFSIGRFGSQKVKNRVLWYRKTSYGKWDMDAALEVSRFTCPTRILTLLTLGIEFLPEAQRSEWRKCQCSTASPLESWRNNAVEGVILYA